LLASSKSLQNARKRFEANIATVASPAQVEIREGISIDASHQAPDVLGDAVLGFELLKPGGVMAFDDYIWSPMRPGTENPLLLPKAAIDAFTTLFSQKIRIIPNLPLYQLYIQKNAGG
jgi:hypothetical protein